MISNLHLIATQALYDQQRYNEIRLLEGTNQGRPYLDTTGNPSVGIGFNLRGNPTVRAEVFLRMEIDPNASGLSAAQQAAELSYLNQLNTASTASYASSLAVQSAFDAIMAARAGNTIFQGITRITNLTTFTMTDPQMQKGLDKGSRLVITHRFYCTPVPWSGARKERGQGYPCFFCEIRRHNPVTPQTVFSEAFSFRHRFLHERGMYGGQMVWYPLTSLRAPASTTPGVIQHA